MCCAWWGGAHFIRPEASGFTAVLTKAHSEASGRLPPTQSVPP
jgi:hypothetical protein